MGFIWVAFDKRKQGFHDKIARTLVIKQPPLTTEQLDKIAVNKAVIEKVDIEAGQEVVQEVEQEGQDPWKE